MSSLRVLSSVSHRLIAPARTARSRWTRNIGIAVSLGLATVAVGIGTGTFASFSATTTNPDNIFSTGKLELSNTKQAGTACISGYSGTGTDNPSSNLDANENTGCDALIGLSLGLPGDFASGRLALANTGDYDGLLDFWLPSGCVDAEVASPSGSRTLCARLEVYIQEYQDATYTTASPTCIFPFDDAGACSPDWSASGDSLVELASLATEEAPQPSIAMNLERASTRYLQISLLFPEGGLDEDGNGADNGYQNRRAAFDLKWRLREA